MALRRSGRFRRSHATFFRQFVDQTSLGPSVRVGGHVTFLFFRRDSTRGCVPGFKGDAALVATGQDGTKIESGLRPSSVTFRLENFQTPAKRRYSSMYRPQWSRPTAVRTA